MRTSGHRPRDELGGCHGRQRGQQRLRDGRARLTLYVVARSLTSPTPATISRRSISRPGRCGIERPNADQSVFALSPSPGHVFAGGAFLDGRWTMPRPGRRSRSRERAGATGLPAPEQDGLRAAHHAGSGLCGPAPSITSAGRRSHISPHSISPRVRSSFGSLRSMGTLRPWRTFGRTRGRGQFTQEKAAPNLTLAVLRTSDAGWFRGPFRGRAGQSARARDGALFVAGHSARSAGSLVSGSRRLDTAGSKSHRLEHTPGRMV